MDPEYAALMGDITKGGSALPSSHATTSETTTISLPLGSLHCEYGAELMSR